MHSDTNQLDVFRDSPVELARVWRIQAETSLKQFPNDKARYRHYIEGAERWERLAGKGSGRAAA